MQLEVFLFLEALLQLKKKKKPYNLWLMTCWVLQGDDAGSNDNGTVVARTFLIRTKTDEDRNKLAAAIKEYSPAS